MKETLDDPFGDHAGSEAAHTLLEAGLAAVKVQLSNVTRLVELLAILPVADPAKPIDPADGRLLLMIAAAWVPKERCQPNSLSSDLARGPGRCT